MRLWGIYFTSWDGKKKCYMNTGFASEQSAKDELNRIYRERERMKDVIEFYDKSRCPSYLTGTDWYIEEMNIIKSVW